MSLFSHKSRIPRDYIYCCGVHKPLKTLGEFTVPVKLHKDVTVHLKVVIEKEAVAE